MKFGGAVLIPRFDQDRSSSSMLPSGEMLYVKGETASFGSQLMNSSNNKSLEQMMKFIHQNNNLFLALQRIKIFKEDTKFL
jgi:hypothetical protein